MIKIKPIIRTKETPDQLVDVLEDGTAVVVRAYSNLAEAKAHDGVIVDEDFDISAFIAERKSVEALNKVEAEKQEALQYLKDTDYIVIKIAEGVATKEEYSSILIERVNKRILVNERVKSISKEDSIAKE
ncbi:MAG: hypothetical protein DRZ90_14830 [Spirochaetes bacterium]|nr:MAG: hypothetical protein DRZ90_14830 [Spirochaetota bacterium]